MEKHSPASLPLRYQDILIDRTLSQDISAEFSLSDYQPEIKRLLRVTATVQPPTRYIGGGNIEFSGNVDFNILYAGEDGALYCFPASTDYNIRTSADGESGLSYLPDDGMSCYATIDSDAVNCRVAGPRRLSLRCRIRSRIRAYGSCSPEEVWVGSLCGTPQRLLKEIDSCRVLTGMSAPLHLQDEILPDRPEDIDTLRIVTADAALLPEEVTTSSDRVGCRGQLLLKLLLQNDPAENEAGEYTLPRIITRKIPFSADIPMEGLLPGADATVRGNCTELHLALEDGRILCEAEVILEAQAQYRERVTYTADLCCVGQHTEVETTPEHFCRPLRTLNTNFSQNDTLSAKDTALPSSARLLDAHGFVMPESTTLSFENNRCTVQGNCRFSLIYQHEGELAAREIELPFRYVTDCGPLPANAALGWDVDMKIVSVKGRLDERDGRLNLDTEYSVSMRLWENAEFYPVSTVRTDAPCTIPAGSRFIYYPIPGETLWSVAKRYCTPVEQISQKNRLHNTRADDPASLEGVHILIV